MRIRSRLGRAACLALSSAGLVLLAVACGSTTQPESGIVNTGTGSVGVRLVWPDGKLIPAASQSIGLAVWKGGLPLSGLQAVLNRPDTSGRIDSVPLGQCVLRATAYPQAGAAGTPQAFGEVTIDVLPGYHEYGTLTMNSTITRVDLAPDPASVTVGSQVTLTATAYNGNNQVVLVPATNPYTWSITVGGSNVSRDSSTGGTTQITGVAAGSATVQATENESGVSGSGTVTVNAAPQAQLATNWLVQGDLNAWQRGNAICYAENAIYVACEVAGLTGGDPSDVMLVSYNLDGTERWRTRAGSTATDSATAVAADGSGHIAVSGATEGQLTQPASGGSDAYVMLFDSTGELLWQRQMGDSGNASADCLAFDGTDLLVGINASASLGAVSPGDIVLAEIAPGNVLGNVSVIGSSAQDEVRGIVAIGGAVYLGGTTWGTMGATSAGGADVFIGRWSRAGIPQWVSQWGSSANETLLALTRSAAGNLVAAGWTLGDFGAFSRGGFDTFLLQCDSSGQQQWRRQLGSDQNDVLQGVACDAAGNVIAVGTTDGGLDASFGGFDLLIVKFDDANNFQQLRQIGTNATDQFAGVTTDPSGNSYTAGYTAGGLVGAASGFEDWVVGCFGP